MIEVLKQALDALETEVSIDWTNNDEFNASAEKMHDAITSLRQAIREHALREVQRLGQEIEQEPVGWLDSNDKLAEFMHKDLKAEHDKYGSTTPRMFSIPVYTHPSQRTWQGLTDEEIDKIRNTPMSVEGGVGFNIYSYARAIEAKLKEKNT